MGYATKNPYTGELLATFPDATDAEIVQAIDNAHNAFLSWKETTFAERSKIMQNAAGSLKRLTLELGGNDAGIVLPDADPKKIVEGLFWGAFIGQGDTTPLPG